MSFVHHLVRIYLLLFAHDRMNRNRLYSGSMEFRRLVRHLHVHPQTVSLRPRQVGSKIAEPVLTTLAEVDFGDGSD